MRWIGGGSVRGEQQTKAAIETFERRWDQYGFGMFALELRATGELIGFTGLAVPQFLPGGMPAVEIGWWLGRAFWVPRARHRSGSRDSSLRPHRPQPGPDHQHRAGRQRRLGAHHGQLGMRLARETVDPTCDRPVRVGAITKAQYLAAGPRSSGDRTARRHVSVLSGKVWVACVS